MIKILFVRLKQFKWSGFYFENDSTHSFSVLLTALPVVQVKISLIFFFFSNPARKEKTTIHFHLTQHKSLPPLVYPPSAWFRKRQRLKWENVQWNPDRKHESHPLSSRPPALRGLVQPDEALSRPHQRACTALIHVGRSVGPPSTAQIPTHYFKPPHARDHNGCSEWTADWRRKLLCMFLFLHVLSSWLSDGNLLCYFVCQQFSFVCESTNSYRL